MYQGQMYPQLNLVVQSPTTPGHIDPLPQSNLMLHTLTTSCQFDMWDSADIPRSDVPLPPINQP